MKYFLVKCCFKNILCFWLAIISNADSKCCYISRIAMNRFCSPELDFDLPNLVSVFDMFWRAFCTIMPCVKNELKNHKRSINECRVHTVLPKGSQSKMNSTDSFPYSNSKLSIFCTWFLLCLDLKNDKPR